MEPPVLTAPIPTQVINEQAAYGPFDLKKFIQVTEGSATPTFTAELSTGSALPQGMICTSDGVITGIPAKDTHGNYEVKITATNEAGSVNTTFVMTIKPSLLGTSAEYSNQLKSQIWEALEKNMPIPDLMAIYERPVTLADVYYLLGRFGVLTIYDAFNLEPPGEKVLLNLPGISKHYNVYDRGSCLVATPKDLFSHERTLLDGLITARIMAREVYRRGWTVELTGFDKLMRTVWVEMQHLGDLYGRHLEVVNFQPTPDDLKLYNTESERLGMGGME